MLKGGSEVELGGRMTSGLVVAERWPRLDTGREGDSEGGAVKALELARDRLGRWCT